MIVPDEEIRGYLVTLFSTVFSVPAHFLLNIDEMGRQGETDAREMAWFVPGDSEEPFVHYPIPRTGKRFTLIACIAADRTFIRSCLVIARKTFDPELLVHGFTPEKIEIYSRTKSSIDLDMFDNSFRSTFLPEVSARRHQFSYEGPGF
jgi:hypothetical protein